MTFTGDSNRKAPTAARVIHGPDKVARFLFGLARRYGPGWLESSQLAMVNGQLGSYTRGAPGSDGYPAMMPRVTAMTVRDGKVCAIWDIANPDKFTGFAAAPPVSRRSVAHGTRHASPELKPCSVMPSAEYMRARMFSTPI